MAETQTKEPKGENWVSSAILVIVGILLLGGIIAGFVLLAESCATPSQHDVKLPPCEAGIICANAYTVGYDYAQNELTADLKYKDKTVRISGRVLEIGKDNAGNAFIDLNSGYLNYLPRFYFKAEDESKLLGFKFNDQIWIQGTGAGFERLPNLIFERAVFINCDMVQFLNPQKTPK